jgi:hypothetical protein
MFYSQVVLACFGGLESLEPEAVMTIREPVVSQVIPLSEAGRARVRLEAGNIEGKLMMRVSKR